MTNPTGEQVTAAIGALRKDAAKWIDMADQMDAAALKMAADGYEQDEVAAVHRMRNIY